MSVKLVSENGVGVVASGVVKGELHVACRDRVLLVL